ncbi:MAG: 4'-phosphopantetheinyl transferase family protein [Candidatus Coproplasma sp.]
MFRLLYTDVTNLTRTDFERLCSTLGAERLKKVKAQKQHEDKYLSAAAGYLLQTALKELNVVNPAILLNEHGKPYLKEGDVFFNLSHSGFVAVCAVSSEEVGVDVQQIKPVNQSLIRRICTGDEYAFVMQDEQGVEERFCRLWTVKESVIKCLGKGLALSPSRVEVKLSSPCNITIDGAESGLHFKEYALSGYRIAVCSKVDNFSSKITKTDIRPDIY